MWFDVFYLFVHPKITSIMAKNKKKQTKQQFLSPTEYINNKARTLKIGK